MAINFDRHHWLPSVQRQSETSKPLALADVRAVPEAEWWRNVYNRDDFSDE